jgi:hypothetical protein
MHVLERLDLRGDAVGVRREVGVVRVRLPESGPGAGEPGGDHRVPVRVAAPAEEGLHLRLRHVLAGDTELLGTPTDRSA